MGLNGTSLVDKYKKISYNFLIFNICYMDSFSSSCFVDGLLAYSFWISRFFGICPLSFEKANKGWHIRPSFAYDFYGKVLISFACALGTYAIISDVFVYPETAFRTKTPSNLMVWIADISIVNIVGMVSAFTAMQRMKNLIVYFSYHEKIKLDLIRMFHDKPRGETKLTIIVICSLIATVSLVIIDFGNFMTDVINNHGKVWSSSLYVFYNLTTIIQQVVIIQFVVIAMRIRRTFKILNDSLNELLQKIIKLPMHQNKFIINSNNFMNSHKKSFVKSINSVSDVNVAKNCGDRDGALKTQLSIPSMLRNLGFTYCSMCDVVRQVDESYSVVLAAIFMSFLLHLVITPYHLIINVFSLEKTDHSDPELQFTWALLHLSNMALVIEPCHLTYKQVELTKIIISQMMRYTPSECGALITELELFYKHIKLNQVSYSPMKMFTLNRSVAIAILGSITTYLVVIVQF